MQVPFTKKDEKIFGAVFRVRSMAEEAGLISGAAAISWSASSRRPR
jgi:hypothetical protein